jgi:hypothetical protein
VPKLLPRRAVAVLAGAALVTGGSLVATAPAYAAPTSIYVATGGNDTTGDGTLALPYATIGQALSSATAGDTIEVGAGSFAGTNVVKAVVIHGAGAASTTVTGDFGISADADLSSVTVSGRVNLGAGAEGATLTGNSFTSTATQVRIDGLDGSPVTTVTDNTFVSPTVGDQPNSIEIGSGSGITISDNVFNGSSTPGNIAAINVIGTPTGVIDDITVDDNTASGYTNFFVAVANGVDGITDIVITDNDASEMSGSAAIYLSENLEDVTVSRNHLHDNGGGVRFTLFNGGSTPGYDEIDGDITVTGNTFADNQRGLRVEENTVAQNILATGNVFVGNTDYAVSNEEPSITVDASGSNWSSGTPGSSGTDSVVGDVEYTPIATEPPFTEPANSSSATPQIGSGTSTVGAVTTTQLGVSKADTWYAVWGYSTKVFLGWKLSSGTGELQVTWPANPLYGNHQLALLTTDGALAGWVAASGLAETAFTKAPVPGISGTAQVGRTLTAIPRSWVPSDATLSYQWKADNVDIPLATGNTLLVTPSLVGKAITLAVTGTKTAYTTTVRTSPATPAVIPGTLVSQIPTISGSRTVGSILTATPGTWGPASVTVTLSYRWLRDGVIISGATAATYTLKSADLNKRIQVQVLGQSPGYTSVRTTSAASPPKTAAARVAVPTSISIGSVAKIGTKLSIVKTGSFASGAKLTYAWKADGVVIKGATSSTYTPVAADFDKPITVTITASKSGYSNRSISAPATDPVVKGTFTLPTATVTAAKVGYSAGVTLTSWGATPTSLRYQWKLNGTDIAGATSANYTPPGASQGGTLSVVVTAVRSGFTSLSATSGGKSVTAGVFASTNKPKITGTPRVGRVLTASVPAWSPAAQFSYQWKLDGNPIVGAVDNTYTVSTEDLGGLLTVTVVGARTGFNSVTETSNPTAAVTP